jgi:hypothetical protein
MRMKKHQDSGGGDNVFARWAGRRVLMGVQSGRGVAAGRLAG